MQPQFLSFHTLDGTDSAEWSRTGKALLRMLGDAVHKQRFAVDFEAGENDPDWYFVARRGAHVFAIVLVVLPFDSCLWSIGLEDGEYRNLNSELLRAEINPILESAVRSWPGVSDVRWHADATTIKHA